jgi:hypothetical protein
VQAAPQDGLCGVKFLKFSWFRQFGSLQMIPTLTRKLAKQRKIGGTKNAKENPD